jgi:hypothetical protein
MAEPDYKAAYMELKRQVLSTPGWHALDLIDTYSIEAKYSITNTNSDSTEI